MQIKWKDIHFPSHGKLFAGGAIRTNAILLFFFFAAMFETVNPLFVPLPMPLQTAVLSFMVLAGNTRQYSMDYTTDNTFYFSLINCLE